jgi:hypothetical protein
MRPLVRLMRLIRDLTHELSDEAAYARYLAATGRLHSGEEWRTFTDRHYRRKYQNAKCC